MKRLGVILLLSLAANAVLGIAWLRSGASKPTEPDATRTTLPGWVTSRSEKKPAVTVASESPAANPSAPPPATKFDWSRIHADDLKEYVARLRAAGCPEETVQDIILAEVERRFAQRRRAIWPEQDDPSAYWKPYPRHDAKVQRERNQQSRALEQEKTALLIELLGVDPRIARREASGQAAAFYDYQDARIGFLPEHKRAAVREYLEQVQERFTEMYERNKGIWDAQTRAEQKALEEEQLRGLAQFLTPDEVRQWELRNSQLAGQLQHDLHTMTLTEEEYGAIFDTRKKYGDSIHNYGDRESREEQEAIKAAKDGLLADLRLALGDDRAREYERSQDYQYQELHRLAKRNELPVATAAQVFDFKGAAEASLKQLREDKSLTAQQRLAAQQAIYDETLNSVKAALGEKAFKSYESSSGWWLRNLKPRPPTPTKTTKK
jgi:hypothetical protein